MLVLAIKLLHSIDVPILRRSSSFADTPRQAPQGKGFPSQSGRSRTGPAPGATLSANAWGQARLGHGLTGVSTSGFKGDPNQVAHHPQRAWVRRTEPRMSGQYPDRPDTTGAELRDRGCDSADLGVDLDNQQPLHPVHRLTTTS
jgi:hypothetical protein